MSRFGAAHPEDGTLLRYVDDELPPHEAGEVARHLEGCPECRGEVEEFRATVAECIRYHNEVLAECLPAPPQPWPDLRREFARVDAAAKEGSWLRRLGDSLRAPALRPWAITAAALAVGIGLYLQLRVTPAVQAATLLKRAVAAAQERPSAGVRRVQVRFGNVKFTRAVGRRRAAAAEDPAAAAVAARFAAAPYDWDDPLSARSFNEWRNGLASKQDQVATIAEGYQIRTATPEGDLAAASLMLRASDLRPIEALLEFRDRKSVELIDIPEASTETGTPPVPRVEPSTRPGVPSRPAAVPSGAPASISDELQVMAALHEIGADLGDPVEVKLEDGKVVVGGVGVPRQRQKQIEARLAGMSNVAIQFSEPAPLPDAQAAPPSAAAAPAQPAPMQTRMEHQLGGRAEFERVSSYLLERDEALMARAYALRALAQRFPAATEAGLSADDRRKLRGMAAQHAAAIEQEQTSISRILEPVLTSMGAASAPRAAVSPQDWQAAAEDLFRAAHRVEILVSATLGASPSAQSPERLPSDVLSATAELHAAAERCRKLLE